MWILLPPHVSIDVSKWKPVGHFSGLVTDVAAESSWKLLPASNSASDCFSRFSEATPHPGSPRALKGRMGYLLHDEAAQRGTSHRNDYVRSLRLDKHIDGVCNYTHCWRVTKKKRVNYAARTQKHGGEWGSWNFVRAKIKCNAFCWSCCMKSFTTWEVATNFESLQFWAAFVVLLLLLHKGLWIGSRFFIPSIPISLAEMDLTETEFSFFFFFFIKREAEFWAQQSARTVTLKHWQPLFGVPRKSAVYTDTADHVCL